MTMREGYCKNCKQVTYWINDECFYCGNKFNKLNIEGNK